MKLFIACELLLHVITTRSTALWTRFWILSLGYIQFTVEATRNDFFSIIRSGSLPLQSHLKRYYISATQLRLRKYANRLR
jgi:hypothetical protein